MTPYDLLLEKLISLHLEYDDADQPGGYKLGWHDPESSRATLYDVVNTAESHDRLRRELAGTGVRHRLVVEPPRPGYSTSNVHILDIDI